MRRCVPGARWGTRMRSTNSPGASVRLLIGGIEAVERNFPCVLALAQHECCAHHDQRRHGIADRRAVGDVAAEGAGIADRRRRETPVELRELRMARDQRFVGIGEIGRGADFETRFRLADFLQFGDVAGIDDRRQVLVLLGDPEPDVGAARQQPRIGVLFAQRSEVLQRHGSVERRLVMPHDEGVAPGDRAQPFDHFALALRNLTIGARRERAIHPVLVPVFAVAAVLVHLHARVDDRPVTRAAAQIAGQRIADLGARRRLARLVQCEERHDEARRAEAALRAMAVDEGLLDRMQRSFRAFQAFDGDELLAVERGHELDARVDRAKAHAVAIEFGEDHGARAAIALGAAFLGAGPTKVLAEEVEHAFRRRDSLDRADLAVQHETDRVAAGRRFTPARHLAFPQTNCRGTSTSSTAKRAAERDNAASHPRCRIVAPRRRRTEASAAPCRAR